VPAKFIVLGADAPPCVEIVPVLLNVAPALLEASVPPYRYRVLELLDVPEPVRFTVAPWLIWKVPELARVPRLAVAPL
jgi:hypothetical protein